MLVQSDTDQQIGKPEYIAQGFITFLREMGVDVPISSSISFFQSLAYVTVSNRNDVYWAGRSTLVRTPEDIPAYDEAFHAFWEDFVVLGDEQVQNVKEMVLAIDNDDYESDNQSGVNQEGELITLKYSRSEILRKKDFAEYSDEELSEAYELMKSIKLIGNTQKSRRASSVAKQNGGMYGIFLFLTVVLLLCFSHVWPFYNFSCVCVCVCVCFLPTL